MAKFTKLIELKAADKISETLSRINRKMKPLTKSARRASFVFDQLQKKTSGFRRSLNNVGNKMTGFGRSVTTGLTLPTVGAGAAAVKVFSDYEQGIVNVRKTTGLESNVIKKTIFDIAKSTPVATEKLFEIAGAAGQLGVKGADNIGKFTATFAKLEKASDIAGEEGTKAVARLLNITGAGIPKVDQFASALVALGNDAAASESEILEVANRVGQSTAQFKIGAGNVLGISVAMKELGINAEAGGTVIGKSFLKIQAAINAGGKETAALSKITGIAQDQLKETFEKDATQVFNKFIKGVARLEKGGAPIADVLGTIGLSGDRVNAILPLLAGKSELLGQRLNQANSEFEKNAALNIEFAEQAKTFSAAMTSFANVVGIAAFKIGEKLAPAVIWVTKKIAGLIHFFEQHPTLAKFTLVVGGVAAAMGPLIVGLGMAVKAIPLVVTGFNALVSIGGFLITPLTAAAGVIAGLSAPAIGAVAAVGALVAAGVALVMKWDKVKAFFANLNIGERISNIANSATQKLKSAFDFIPGIGDDEPVQLAGQQNAPLPGLGGESSVQTNNARVQVDFSNIPKGTQVKQSGDAPLDLSLGFAGAF